MIWGVLDACLLLYERMLPSSSSELELLHSALMTWTRPSLVLNFCITYYSPSCQTLSKAFFLKVKPLMLKMLFCCHDATVTDLFSQPVFLLAGVLVMWSCRLFLGDWLGLLFCSCDTVYCFVCFGRSLTHKLNPFFAFPDFGTEQWWPSLFHPILKSQIDFMSWTTNKI